MILPALPEKGEKADFKHAFFRTIPPVPYYQRLRWYEYPSYRYSVLVNGMLALNNLLAFVVNVYCREATFWNSLGSLGGVVFQVFVIWILFRLGRKADGRLENSFYALAAQLGDLATCPDHHDVHISENNTHRVMANLLRRNHRSFDNDFRVWIYNLFHRGRKKCKCCLQIQHGYRNNRCELLVSKRIFKYEKCPFCGWDF